MRINTYEYPKSSFLSIEKDMSIITDKILKNENLKKMLYYTSKDCLSRPILTDDQSLELFSKNIKLVPKLYVDKTLMNYILINFDSFVPNANNPEFRNNIIEFNIICHFSQWQMDNFKLRPYRIAAELDTMFNDRHLTGIGDLKFAKGTQILMTDEYAGLSLKYVAIHGGEDKVNALTRADEESLIENFNKVFNNNE